MLAWTEKQDLNTYKNMGHIFYFNPPLQDSEEVTGYTVTALGGNTLNLIPVDLQKSNVSDISLKKKFYIFKLVV